MDIQLNTLDTVIIFLTIIVEGRLEGNSATVRPEQYYSILTDIGFPMEYLYWIEEVGTWIGSGRNPVSNQSS